MRGRAVSVIVAYPDGTDPEGVEDAIEDAFLYVLERVEHRRVGATMACVANACVRGGFDLAAAQRGLEAALPGATVAVIDRFPPHGARRRMAARLRALGRRARARPAGQG